MNTTAPYYINAVLTVSKSLHFSGNAVINEVISNAAGVTVTGDGFNWYGPTLNGPQYDRLKLLRVGHHGHRGTASSISASTAMAAWGRPPARTAPRPSRGNYGQASGQTTTVSSPGQGMAATSRGGTTGIASVGAEGEAGGGGSASATLGGGAGLQAAGGTIGASARVSNG